MREALQIFVIKFVRRTIFANFKKDTPPEASVEHWYQFKSMLSLCLYFLYAGSIAAGTSSSALGPYSIKDYSVSGLSSGGFMAVQVHVAFSSMFNGSAVFAGVHFSC